MTGKASYALADVIFRGHQVLHLSPEQFVGSVQLILQVGEGLQLSGERQHAGLFLASFGLGAVALLGVTGRDGLLLGQHLKKQKHVNNFLVIFSYYFLMVVSRNAQKYVCLNQRLSSF